MEIRSQRTIGCLGSAWICMFVFAVCRAATPERVTITLADSAEQRLALLPGAVAVRSSVLAAAKESDAKAGAMWLEIIERKDASNEQRGLARLLLSRLYRRQGRANEAEETLKEAEGVYRNQVEPKAVAWMTAASLLAESGHLEDALTAWRAADLPGLGEEVRTVILTGLGDALVAAGKSREAVDAFTKATELPAVPNEIIARILLKRGRANLAARDAQAALNDYTRLSEWIERPDEERALAYICISEARLGLQDYEQAAAAATKVIDDLPLAAAHKILARQCRASALTKMRRYEDAEKDISLIQDDPKAGPREKIQASLLRVEIERHRQDAAAVIRLVEGILSDKGIPRDLEADALTLRGLAHAALKDAERALGDFEKALAIPECSAPRRHECLLDRGTLRMQQGLLKDAGEDFERATRLAGVPPREAAKAWMRLGAIHEKLGRLDEMSNALERCVELDPGEENVRTVLPFRAVTLSNARRYEEAIADFTRVLDLKDLPEHTRIAAHALRSGCYFSTGQKEKGIADLTVPIEHPTSDPATVAKMLFRRADVYDELGRTDDGDADRKRARMINEKLLKK